MGYFIYNQPVSEEVYNRWLLGQQAGLQNAFSGLGGLGGLTGLGQQAAQAQLQAQSYSALAQMQAQAVQRPIASVSHRTHTMLAEFDWDQASNLHYIDSFFGKWGFEPLEIPGY